MEKQIITPGYIVNSIIGMSIMLFGRFFTLPSIVVPQNEKLLSLGFESLNGMITFGISDVGMTVITLFLGLVYLWTFVSIVWPCFMGIFLLGASNFGSMNSVLTLFLGNPTVVFVFGVFLFLSAFLKLNIPTYVARAMLVNKFTRNKPWIFITMLLLTPYVVALSSATLTTPFIVWPIYQVIFDVVGYTKEDKFVKVLTVFSIAMLLCAFTSDIFKAGAFMLLNGLKSTIESSSLLSMQPLENTVYFGFVFLLSMIVLACFVFTMRFIMKIDVTKLKEFDVDILNANPLPPFNIQQISICLMLLAYILWLLLPSLIPDGAIKVFMKSNVNGGIFFILAITSMLHFNNKPFGEFTQNVTFGWGSFYIVSTSLMYGAAVASPVTLISLYLEYVLSSLFTGVSYFTLIIGVILIGIVLTNIFNSVVTGLIMGPILVSLCNALGYNPTPLIMCFFYSVLFAILTPAGSPFAAMLFANENLNSKDVIRYGALSTIIVILVTIIVGIPLASAIY